MRQQIAGHIHSLGSCRFTPRMFIPAFNLRGFSMSQLSSRARIYDAGIATRIVVAPRSNLPAYPPNVTIRAISIDSDRLGFGIEYARIAGMPLAWSMRLLPRLPIHSRCYLARRWAPRTPPWEPLQLVPRAEKPRPSRGPTTRAAVRGALLTYRLPPISYTRNIANRITDARARVRPRPNEIAFAYGTDCPVLRVKDLARPWCRPRVRVPLPTGRTRKRSLDRRLRYHARA